MASKSTRSTVTVNRTNPGVREYESKHSYTFSAAPAAQGSHIHSNVSNVVEGREKEKRDMQELNERLANYIEKVRFLEAQNKKLSTELNTLRERWGKEAERIKDIYEVEMIQLKKLLDEADSAKTGLTPRVGKLESQLHDYLQAIDEGNSQHDQVREVMDKLNRQLSECEGEIGLLRRRIAALEEERSRRKKKLNKQRDDVKRTRMDLDNETMNHIAAESEVQSLRDEIEFMKESHDNEMKELASLAYRDTTSENRDYWKHEMASSLREMQKEYHSKMDALKGEMESHYTVKVQELKNANPREGFESTHLKEENSRLRTQLNNVRSKCPELEAKNTQLERLLEELRRELERQSRDFDVEKDKIKNDLKITMDELSDITKELHNVMDLKLSLELEIAAYRKLLEGEESRAGLRSMVEQTILKSHGLEGFSGAKSSVSTSQLKGEINAKTSYQRNTKGNVAIQEASPDGKFITLENTGKKEEDISGFKLVRNIDNGKAILQYEFPTPTILRSEGAEKTVKIWARGNRPPGSKDLECQNSSWGTGNHVYTALINKSNEERATHTQKTVF